MNRIPIFDVEESESLTKNLSFVVGLDPETLFGIKPPTKPLFQRAQDGFNHCRWQVADGVLNVERLR